MSAIKIIADAIKEAGFDPLAMTHEQGADEIIMALGASPGLLDVLAERVRQTLDEGWTPEHDDKHGDGSLGAAACCYIAPEMAGEIWPWGFDWWKPKDRRRNLVIAGALIIAEIDRLDRAATATKAA